MGKKKIKINKDKCLGCGSCTFMYPEMFYLDENGKAEVKELKKIDEEKLQSAIDACAAEAIEIEEE